MKRILTVTAVLVLAAAPARADDPTRVYTNPGPLPRDVLDRLNLKQDWRANVPIEGRRDGLFSVQLTARDILVQTRSGLIAALDPDTGELRWRTRVGNAYPIGVPLGYNNRFVFYCDSTWLFAIDRDTGTFRWQYELNNAPTVAPVADDEQVHLCLGAGRVDVFLLRNTGEAKGPKKGDTAPPPLNPYDKSGDKYDPTKGLDRTDSIDRGSRAAYRSVGTTYGRREPGLAGDIGPPPVVSVYDYNSGDRLEQTPILTKEWLFFAGGADSVFTLSKVRPKEGFRFKTEGLVTLAPGQNDEMAYVASQDQTVYAINIVNGRVPWRFTTDALIVRKPEVTDEDVYVTPAGEGLVRLDRATGKPLWRSKRADRYLASNPKFTYATDRTGKLLVLERARGTVLAEYDAKDFAYPVPNEYTDRLFLASHDGTIVCLHDREYDKPVTMKKFPDPNPPKPDKTPLGGGDKPKEDQPPPKGPGPGMDKKP